MKYSWLLFDADGTLFDFEKAQEQALRNTFKNLRINFRESYYQSYQEINTFLWKRYERAEIKQDRIPYQRFYNFFEENNILADAQKASELYLEYLGREHELLDGAEELIKKLATEYKLVLITNGLKSVQRPRFLSAVITPYFEEIIISEEVGFAKPQKEIFDITFERINNPPKEVVMIIGDNPGSDILGGIEYGIDSCWYNPSAEELYDGIIPTYEIRNYDELIELLED